MSEVIDLKPGVDFWPVKRVKSTRVPKRCNKITKLRPIVDVNLDALLEQLIPNPAIRRMLAVGAAEIMRPNVRR